MPCITLNWRLGGASASCGLRCWVVIAVNILFSLVGAMPATPISVMVVAVAVTVVATTFVLIFDLMFDEMILTMFFTIFVLVFDVKIVTMFVTMLLMMLFTMFFLMVDVKIVAMLGKVVVFLDNVLIQGLRWLFVVPFLIVNCY
jgi:hypothetical protein